MQPDWWLLEDTNGDGKISRTEFRRAMEFLKLPSTDAEIDELFDKFDRDGSGSLNFKELQKENARLKRMLADEMLGKELLKEALEKKL